MFFWITVAAWLTAVIVGYGNGNRIMPTIILLLGIADIAGMLFFNVGWLGLSALAVLAVVMLIANKIDAVNI